MPTRKVIATKLSQLQHQRKRATNTRQHPRRKLKLNAKIKVLKNVKRTYGKGQAANVVKTDKWMSRMDLIRAEHKAQRKLRQQQKAQARRTGIPLPIVFGRMQKSENEAAITRAKNAEILKQHELEVAKEAHESECLTLLASVVINVILVVVAIPGAVQGGWTARWKRPWLTLFEATR